MTRLPLPVVVAALAFVLITQAACGSRAISQPDAPRVVTFRQDQTTTLLWDGRVLVTGGRDRDGAPLASAEVYDPATGAWSATGAMGMPRYGHTASVLLDGRVLVTGGSGCRWNCTEADAYATADVFDPVAETWTPTTNMGASRQWQAAAVLADGRVLVSGGRGIQLGGMRAPAGFPPSLRSSEVYDPRTGRWSPLSPMHRGRAGHHAVALWDGRVVMAGGYEGTLPRYGEQKSEQGSPETVEVFDPATGAWTLSPRAMIKNIDWVGARSDGSVLVAGGLYQDRVQRYEPDRQQWSEPWDRDPGEVDQSTLVLLDDARLFAVGGLSETAGANVTAAGTTALLHMDREAWTPVAALITPRVRHTAVRLPDGRVLVYGGHQYREGWFGGGRSPVLTSEVYDPASNRWSGRGAESRESNKGSQ
jgi:hypothetical protein